MCPTSSHGWGSWSIPGNDECSASNRPWSPTCERPIVGTFFGLTKREGSGFRIFRAGALCIGRAPYGQALIGEASRVAIIKP